MPYDPHKHHRRSIRLPGYDYSQPGSYFVTLCVQDRACLFGDVANGEMVLNAAGQMMQAVWFDIPIKFPSVRLDEFVIMPNHAHFIIELTDIDVGIGVGVGVDLRVYPNDEQARGGQARGRSGQARGRSGQARGPAPTTSKRPSLSDVVQWYKSMTTTQYRHGVYDHGWPPFNGHLWQRNYYERIIRDERAYQAIRHYIRQNPANWRGDQLHPEAPLSPTF